MVSNPRLKTISAEGHLEGEQTYLGDLLTMVIDHLQVDDPPSNRPIFEASFATLAVEVGCREHFFCLS